MKKYVLALAAALTLSLGASAQKPMKTDSVKKECCSKDAKKGKKSCCKMKDAAKEEMKKPACACHTDPKAACTCAKEGKSCTCGKEAAKEQKSCKQGCDKKMKDQAKKADKI